MPSKKVSKTEPVAVVETTPATSNKKVSKTKQTEKTQVKPVKVEAVETKKDTKVEEVTTTDSNTVVEMPKNISQEFTEIVGKIQKIVTEFSQLKLELKSLEKKTMKELKVVTKLQNKRKKKQGVRAPSGFVKPTKISDELAVFLQKPSGTEMARTDVTREINAYIREHQLQDKTNGRKIIPDDKLAKLLKVKDNDELTYFNLQRYMSPHFTKSAQVVTATA